MRRTISLIACAATLSLGGATTPAQAHRAVPRAPFITSITRSCVTQATTMTFVVLTYDARSHSWDAATGQQPVQILGRGGGIRQLGWGAFDTTTALDGYGYRSWAYPQPFAYELRLRLADGTLSPIRDQPEGCTPPAPRG